MGAHSLPRTHQVHAGRIAGTGVLAALTLAGTAGTAGVALAHGDGDDGGHGHGSSTTTATTHRSVAQTDGDDVFCDVFGDVDVPGISCDSDDASRSIDTVAQRTEATPRPDAERGTQSSGTAPSAASAPSSSTPAAAPQSTPPSSTQGTTRNAGTAPQNTQQETVQPRTSGNPIDAPGEPGTTRTLPIGG